MELGGTKVGMDLQPLKTLVISANKGKALVQDSPYESRENTGLLLLFFQVLKYVLRCCLSVAHLSIPE